MKQEIYAVYCYFYKTKDFTLDSVAFKDRESAIQYIESKLTTEEIEKNRKAKNRNLMSWYEFTSKDICYNIKVLDLK